MDSAILEIDGEGVLTISLCLLTQEFLEAVWHGISKRMGIWMPWWKFWMELGTRMSNRTVIVAILLLLLVGMAVG